MNLCMSTLPNFDLQSGLALSRDAGFTGIELRVHDQYHISLNELYHKAREVRELVDSHQLDLSVFNTYYGINDECAVDTLIRACRRSGVRYFRVVLPVAGCAQVADQAIEGAVIPSYIDKTPIGKLIPKVRHALRALEAKAKAANVTAMVEIHWGTVMSSFAAAHLFMEGIDPSAVALTFDPANMVIEGKEDWEFGIALLHQQFANLHIKNASWFHGTKGWQWGWSALEEGLVDWPALYQLLARYHYQGLESMEDFRVPRDYDNALQHLRHLIYQVNHFRAAASIATAA